MTTERVFRFDRSYDNLEQVAEYLPAFMDVLAEIEAAGQYRYNNSFRGRVPGIEGPDEDTAIYLLQGLERKRAQDARVESLLGEGYVFVDWLPNVMRYAHVILVPTRRMGGEWQELHDARVSPDSYGNPLRVLPKGKRTNGYRVADRKVLVKP